MRRSRRQSAPWSWPVSSSPRRPSSARPAASATFRAAPSSSSSSPGGAGAASWFFYFLALRDGTATGVAALDRLSVVLVFVLAVVFLGEAFSLKAALGALLVVAGAVLLT